MIRDVEFFESRLGKIDGFENAADYLLKIIRNKQVLRDPEPVANAANLALPPAPSPAPLTPPVPSSGSSDAGGNHPSGETATPAPAEVSALAVVEQQNGEP